MLIWDTGEYEILPWRRGRNLEVGTDGESDAGETDAQPENEKLIAAFQAVPNPYASPL